MHGLKCALQNLLQANRPFDPRRVPFYYGWVVLFFGTAGMIAAVPGSPPGLAVFIDEWQSDLGITRDAISLAYAFAMVTAGLAAPVAGVWIDRYGVRWIGIASYLLLGVVLLATAFLPVIQAALMAVFPDEWVAFLLFVFIFAGLRISGVSFAMTVCRTMVFRWFTTRRNLAAIANGMVLSLAFSSIPVALNWIARGVGTQSTWIGLAVFFGVFFTTFTYLFFRDSPESCGIEPDTTAKSDARNLDEERPDTRHFTSREALQTLSFWAIVSVIVLYAMTGTGSSFHIVALGEAAGVERDRVLAWFIPIGVVNCVTTLVVGWYSRRMSVRSLVFLMLAAMVFTTTGLLHLGTTWGATIYILGSGVGWGVFGLLISVPWPRFYGRRHLGAISGVLTGVIVVTSGIGPYFFGICYSLTGTFNTALWIALGISPLCLVLAFWVRNPQKNSVTSTGR